MRHTEEAQCVAQGTNHNHPKRTKAVGHHARKDAEHPPGQVLDGDGKGKGLAGPALSLGDGL